MRLEGPKLSSHVVDDHENTVSALIYVFTLSNIR